MRITEGRYLTMWAVRVVFQISSGPPRTRGRSTVPREPLDDRRQLGEVARFGVRRGIGGTPTKGGAGDPYGPHPQPRGALHVGHERVSDVDHVPPSDPEGFEGRLEDPRARVVRLRRLRRNQRAQAQAVAFEDVQEELVIRIRDDGPRDAIQRIEDPRDFGVPIRLAPPGAEAVDIRLGGRLDAVLAKRLLEAVFRDLRQREEWSGLRREEVTVPGREEGLRVEAWPPILGHGPGDAD